MNLTKFGTNGKRDFLLVMSNNFIPVFTSFWSYDDVKNSQFVFTPVSFDALAQCDPL